MSNMDRVPGPDNLYVGGIWVLNIESYRNALYENNITHVLSVIKWSFDKWGEEAKRFEHLSIDINDMEDSDLLVHLPAAVRFIDRGLHPEASDDGVPDNGKKPPGVYVHCAMGKSRSVSCVIAYLLYKHPERFGGIDSAASPALRRKTAKDAVRTALECVREARSHAEPNDGFMKQLALWWEWGCPADDDGAVERHPGYQRWLYEKMLEEARNCHMAPDTENIRFEDEIEDGHAAEGERENNNEIRCKKCRRILATPKFVVPHAPYAGEPKISDCAHIFVDTLSWMRPALEDGALDGRLVCPNNKCGATVGRFAWQGFKCTCKKWITPAFSLNRSRVDEVTPRAAGATGIRMPPGRNGSL
ncbi:protein-tyrosine phosphatase-like protein [Xylariaceae sp. FL0016]|nr:protein-tyrosine phosphatase-like protein [Xylariaceae sp. FL0016]